MEILKTRLIAISKTVFLEKFHSTGILRNYFEGTAFHDLGVKIVFLELTLSRRRSYQVETNPLICSANQWTGFYMIGTSVMKELECRTILYFHCYN